MAPEPINHDAPSNKQKSMDQEIKELISALTNRLGSIQRSPNNPGDSGSQDEEDQGVRIITLAGSNVGATMRGEVDDKLAAGPQGLNVQPEQDDFATYVNSNFQAINNSIMLGGSYETNDPGVHLDILDNVEEQDDDEDETAEHGEIKARKAKVGGGRGSDRQNRDPIKNTTDGERN